MLKKKYESIRGGTITDSNKKLASLLITYWFITGNPIVFSMLLNGRTQYSLVCSPVVSFIASSHLSSSLSKISFPQNLRNF